MYFNLRDYYFAETLPEDAQTQDWHEVTEQSEIDAISATLTGGGEIYLDKGKLVITGKAPSLYHRYNRKTKRWSKDNALEIAALQQAKDAKRNTATDKAQAIINEVAGVDSLPEFEVQSWATQADEAQAWAKDERTPTPILSAIAQARGIPVDTLRQKALEKAQAYALLTATIAGQRQRFEDAIKAATDLDALNAIDITYQLPQVSA